MNLFDVLMGPTFGKVLDRLLPDPAAKANAQMELIKLQQAGELKELEAAVALAAQQSDVNKIEAASSDPFVSRWRPFIGWVCGFGLTVQFVIAPFVTWGSRLAGHAIDFPTLNTETLMTLLFGMLGLGAYRTAEKIKGAA